MAGTIYQTHRLILFAAWLVAGNGLTSQSAFAQSPEASTVVERVTEEAPDVIFSNLEPLPGDRYNGDAFSVLPIAGRNASGETETWIGVLFTPKFDVQAKVILAAIGYTSGTKQVNLGIYSYDASSGSVGDPLIGAQGVITQMPDVGDCCRLAKVTLAGDGVVLTAGTGYWLVASPDNVNASTFEGGWHVSHQGQYSYLSPPLPWIAPASQWPAVQIRGTIIHSADPENAHTNSASSGEAPAARRVTVFSNLGPTSFDRYDNGGGVTVSGSSDSGGENWIALPFLAKENVHATTLAAAVGYVSGTRLMNLGIFSDNDGTVGTPLAGGQGSSTDIPDFGSCCDLARVVLPGEGVTLSKGTRYWLVASPDNSVAPDFKGFWQASLSSLSAYQQPELFINWTDFLGGWLAARIDGTNP